MSTVPAPDIVAAYQEAEAARRATGRQCGSCTMCCTILGVDESPNLV